MDAGRTKPQFLEDENGAVTTSYGPFLLRSAFQPIFSQDQSGQLTVEAFEALIRPQRGREPISPFSFFSMVEAEDALHVDTLCRELHIVNMGRMNRRNARLFVNFNPGLIREEADIGREVERMLEACARAGLRPGRIVCEITEQGGSSTVALGALAAQLRASLFRIAIDDYGAEDSDIQRVDQLRPDFIKFDAAWVRRFTETSAGQGLLRLMVEQFVGRNILCLFEGLEEEDQVAFCRRIGVRLLQGYVLARPEIAPTTFDERFPEAGPSPRSQTALNEAGRPVPRPAARSPEEPLAAADMSAAPGPARFPRRTTTFGRRHR